MAAELDFAAMGSHVHLVVVGPEEIAEEARRRVEQLEGRWSRFRPDSEVSRLNASQGELVAVSADTSALLRTAVEAWRMSGGLVDCTMLDALEAAGYDTSFEAIPEDRPARAGSALPASLLGPSDIEVAGATAGLPPGLRFDPGGIGKGLAADIVSSEAMARGAEGVCINIGGDLRVSGVAPSGGDWTIGVEHPRRSSPVVLLGLREGAVATSTTLRRAWRVGGRSVHHLIDPRTGAPSESPTVLATAVAASGWMAETLAKATLLRGEHPFDLVGGSDAEAIVVTHDGTVSASPGLQRFTGHAEPPVSILEEVAS